MGCVCTCGMRKLSFIISLASQVVMSQTLNENSAKADSLSYILDSKAHDTIRAVAMIEKAELIYQTKTDEALVLCHEAERLSLLSDFELGLSFSYGWLGFLYQLAGEGDKAIQYLEKSNVIFRNSGDEKSVSQNLSSMGIIHLALGRIQEAMNCFTNAMSIQQKRGDLHGYTNSLNTFASLYRRQGNFKEAESLWKEAIGIQEQSSDIRGLALTNMNLATLYSASGIPGCQLNREECTRIGIEKALELLRKSIDYCRNLGDQKLVADCLTNYGCVYIKKGNLPLAEEALSEADSLIAIVGSATSKTMVALSLANLYELQNRFEMARISLTNCDKYIRSQSLDAKNNWNKLWFKYYRELSMPDSALGHILSVIETQNQQLFCHFAFLSEAEKEMLVRTASSSYDMAYGFAVLSGHLRPEIAGEVFDVSLLTKGLLLKSSTAVSASILASGDSILTRQYQNWIGLKRKIAIAYSIGSTVTDLEKKANDLEKQLVKQSSDFSELNRIQDLTWKDVRSNLKDGEGSIEFVRFLHHEDYHIDSTKKVLYCAMILTKDSENPELVRLFTEPELEKILGTFPGNNLSYIEQVYGSGQNTKTQLYDLIWKPMEKSLNGLKKVYVSPVGLLHKISFSALAKEQDIYLCDLFEIETKSSTGTIAVNSEPVVIQRDDLSTIFGGIEYNADSSSHVIWPYLDGSMSETKQIAKIIEKRGARINYYNLTLATEEQFKQTASESNILHIATHGFFYADPDEVLAEVVDETESFADLNFRGGTSGFGVQSFVKSSNPLMRSGLVFAGANDVWSRTNGSDDFKNIDSTYKEDGVLTAAEVAWIPEPVDTPAVLEEIEEPIIMGKMKYIPDPEIEIPVEPETITEVPEDTVTKVCSLTFTPLALCENVIFAKEMTLTLYPNPTVDRATLVLDVPETRHGEITLYSLAGDLLEQLFEGEIPAGKVTVDLNLSSYPTGTYLVNVQTAQGSKRIKVQKVG